MTENDYIAMLKESFPRTEGCEIALETIALCDEAVRAFPRSCALWVLRGDLLHFGPEDCPYPLEESLVSYRRAIEIDAGYAEAWEEVAHFLDAVMSDEEAAAPYFAEFHRLKAESKC